MGLFSTKDKIVKKEHFEKRGRELKEILTAAAQEFVKNHCKCKAHYLSPIHVIKNAWMKYCSIHGLTEQLEEYFGKEEYYEEFGNISLGDTIYQYPLGRPLFYVGIRLKS